MSNTIKINLPDNVKFIINKLSESGYEAYAVGGCVRDSILGRIPGDWDITTSALPHQVKAVFNRTIDTGIEHGTVTVMLGKEGYEVTTYRIDGDYKDSRHPESVEFTSNLILDLERRDFTINAMAYNDEKGIVDAFDGVKDLENKVIRCVGSAMERFTEDALRILRAVRFSAQLGFEIETATTEAIIKLAPTLAKISKERIHTEFNKMLKSPHPEYFERASALGITKVVIPEYDMNKEVEREFSSMFVKLLPEELSERYAALIFWQGDKVVEKVLRELKLDNNTITVAGKLVRFLDIKLVDLESELRKLIYKVGDDFFLRLMHFRICYEQALKNQGKLNQLEKAVNQYNMAEHILNRGDCVNLKKLAIGGNDLMQAGIEPGKSIGIILGKLLYMVLEDQSINEKDILLKRVQEIKKTI